MSTAAVTRHILGVIAALNNNSENDDSSRHDAFVTMAAVSSRDAVKASEFAAKHNIPRSYGSHEELLADPDVDAVYITMPNHVHSEWIIRSIAAGKHVLCEKPMVLSSEEAARVHEAHSHYCALHGRTLIVMEAVMSLYTPQTRQLENLLSSGTLGQLQYLRGSFQYNMTRNSFRSSSTKEGGGSLLDVGCYPIYLARYLLKQEPVSCSGTAVWSSDDHETNYDATFSGTLTFPGGVALHIDSSLVTPFGTASFELHGTKGSAILSNPFKPSSSADGIVVNVVDQETGKQSTTFLSSSPTAATLSTATTLNATNPYYGELGRFCDLVVMGSSNSSTEEVVVCPTNPQFALGQAQCMEALLQSARSGNTVALSGGFEGSSSKL